MRGHTAGIAYRRESANPYVEIWSQPHLRWSFSVMYHVWEKASGPAMKYVSKWHRKLFGKSESYIPLVNRQDIRCDRLTHAERVTLAVIYVTMDQYDIITGHAPPTQALRHEVKQPIIPEPEMINS